MSENFKSTIPTYPTTGMYTPWGLKNKTINQAHHHHHRGQNRPHQKTITYPQGPPPPPEPAQPHVEFLCGSEGLMRPPCPSLNGKNISIIERLLYDRHY